MLSVPENKIYTIGEISSILEVKEHTIRFWESKFPWLNPSKSGTGRRKYTKEDLLLLQQIKKLLYEDRFTLKGAIQELSEKTELTSQAELNVKMRIEEENLFESEENKRRQNLVQNNNQDSKYLFQEQKIGNKIEKDFNQAILQRVYNKIDNLIDLWENYRP